MKNYCGPKPELEVERDRGYNRVANHQKEVARSASPIKWSMPLPLIETVKTQMVREER